MPEIPASEWDKDKFGGLIVCALVGWGTIGATDGNSGVLRLEYATDQTLKERAAIQLFVSPPRMRELAEGLKGLPSILNARRPQTSRRAPGPKSAAAPSRRGRRGR
jgi:hypothetical protein